MSHLINHYIFYQVRLFVLLYGIFQELSSPSRFSRFYIFKVCRACLLAFDLNDSCCLCVCHALCSMLRKHVSTVCRPNINMVIQQTNKGRSIMI